ncbi:MAG: glycosyltransferase family 87 protein [Anaerolineales bacterium]
MFSFVKHELTEKNESLFVRIRKRPIYYIFVFLLLINISLIAINAGIWIIAARQKLFVAADFTSFYTGYYMVRVGDGANLYDMAAQARYQEQFMGGLIFEGGVLLFANPPFVAIIFSPLSLLPLGTAFYLWTIVQLILLICMLYSITRLFSHWNNHERLLLITTILAFWPLTSTFLLGQFSLLILLGLLQMYIAIRHSRLGKAGLWLVLLTIKPQTLPIPGMIVLNKRNWHGAVTTAISGIAIIIFSSIFLGIGTWIQYIQVFPTISNNFGKFGFIPDIQYTLRGLLTNILGYSQASIINIISISVFIGGIVFVWLLWMQGVFADSQRFKLYFAFTILLSAFLSLHSYPHDDLILVLPAALFYDYLRENNYPRKAYSILILISPIVFFIAAFSSFDLFGIFRPPVIIILIFLVCIVYYLILDHRKEHINQQTELSPTISS